MASRQHHKLRGAVKKNGSVATKSASHALGQRCKSRFDVANGAGIQDRDLLPDAAAAV